MDFINTLKIMVKYFNYFIIGINFMF